jgi:hypothetical protein
MVRATRFLRRRTARHVTKALDPKKSIARNSSPSRLGHERPPLPPVPW